MEKSPHIGIGNQNLRGKFNSLRKQSLWDRQRKNTVKTRQYSKGIAIKYEMYHQDIHIPFLGDVRGGKEVEEESGQM